MAGPEEGEAFGRNVGIRKSRAIKILIFGPFLKLATNHHSSLL